MTSARYFVLEPMPGAPLKRYAVLCNRGRTVIAIQCSRPEGREVERPADVIFRIGRPAIDREPDREVPSAILTTAHYRFNGRM